MQSAVHVLNGSKENASALSLLNEKRLVRNDNGLGALAETRVGVPLTSENVVSTTSGVLQDNNGPTRGSCAVEDVAKNTSFTGSTVSVMPENKLKGTKSVPFTLVLKHIIILNL